jgi:acyl-CoA synthetase (AMP-forming)/AMP-acid ligase II
MSQCIVNVAQRLSESAERNPEGIAVVEPGPARPGQPRQYTRRTFRDLDRDTDGIAAGLQEMGVLPGTRLALLVRPGIDFVALVFALLKSGAVMILVDPGMGRRNVVACLEEAEPQGFVAIPLVQAIRTVLRGRFPHAAWNVTVGRRRWPWGGTTLSELRQASPSATPRIATCEDDPAAIIFTSGSTGPPKGVLYRHGNFDRQVVEIRDFYGIQPGEIDVPGFPLFALFNAAMGVTTVFPDMDFSRPAQADPRNILEAASDWRATQAFGSPALWNVVGRYCEQTGGSMPTVRRILSAGAPVPPHVLERMKRAIHAEGELHTPYGATESLPVASISATEVLAETAARSRDGAGTCVGRRFPGIDWKVIRITDEPLRDIEDAVEVPRGDIGELIVQGPVVTREYVTRTESNALHKIRDKKLVWHRMGDVGYLDEQDRFWFCGRKSHRVRTARGTLFTIPCEAIFNCHRRVYRSALVGVGQPGQQRPVVVVEPWPEFRPHGRQDEEQLVRELVAAAANHPLTSPIRDVLIANALPVDTRHNSKIFREQLAVYAARRLGEPADRSPLRRWWRY